MRFTSAVLFAGLLLAAPVQAESDNGVSRQDSKAQPSDEERPAATLASAADLKIASPQLKAAAQDVPKRPRTARVTTCRCGGDTPQD